jgi:hypothetical protein
MSLTPDEEKRLTAMRRTRMDLERKFADSLANLCVDTALLAKRYKLNRSIQARDDLVTSTQFPVAETAAWTELVERTCREHQIEVTWSEAKIPTGIAWSGARSIYVRRPTSPEDLACAFHEIGHVMTWNATDRRVMIDGVESCCPISEVNAWNWARKTLGWKWTKPMEAQARRCLGTYLHHTNDAERVSYGAEWGVIDREHVFSKGT